MTELSVCENCRRIGCTGYDEEEDGSCPAYLPHFQGVAISTCEKCGGRMRVDRAYWVCDKCGFQRHVLTAPERARKLIGYDRLGGLVLRARRIEEK